MGTHERKPFYSDLIKMEIYKQDSSIEDSTIKVERITREQKEKMLKRSRQISPFGLIPSSSI